MSLSVLTYHRVANLHADPSLSLRSISAVPESFALQMRHLRQHYAPVSMQDLLSAIVEQKPLPPRAVLITFDDAYHDFVDWAWPTLKSLGLPATLFVPTAYPDHPERSFWQDRLHWAFSRTTNTEICLNGTGVLSLRSPEERSRSLRVLLTELKSLPHPLAQAIVERACQDLGEIRPPLKSVLTWNELRQLASEGLTLGSHSQTHPVLTRVGLEDVRQEVVGARRDLEREIGRVPPIFCYPTGAHDQAVVSVLAEEGIRLAFTTLDGHNDPSRTDRLRLRRTNISRRTTPFLFRFRLNRWVSVIDRWRHGDLLSRR